MITATHLAIALIVLIVLAAVVGSVGVLIPGLFKEDVAWRLFLFWLIWAGTFAVAATVLKFFPMGGGDG